MCLDTLLLAIIQKFGEETTLLNSGEEKRQGQVDEKEGGGKETCPEVSPNPLCPTARWGRSCKAPFEVKAQSDCISPHLPRKE